MVLDSHKNILKLLVFYFLSFGMEKFKLFETGVNIAMGYCHFHRLARRRKFTEITKRSIILLQSVYLSHFDLKAPKYPHPNCFQWKVHVVRIKGNGKADRLF